MSECEQELFTATSNAAVIPPGKKSYYLLHSVMKQHLEDTLIFFLNENRSEHQDTQYNQH